MYAYLEQMIRHKAIDVYRRRSAKKRGAGARTNEVRLDTIPDESANAIDKLELAEEMHLIQAEVEQPGAQDLPLSRGQIFVGRDWRTSRDLRCCRSETLRTGIETGFSQTSGTLAPTTCFCAIIELQRRAFTQRLAGMKCSTMASLRVPQRVLVAPDHHATGTPAHRVRCDAETA